MNYFCLDTNILLGLIQTASSRTTRRLLQYGRLDRTFVISVVVVGEIRSIALQNRWGERKQQLLQTYLDSFAIIPLEHENILDLYVQIDAFSQNRHPNVSLEMTPRNMGKNDL